MVFSFFEDVSKFLKLVLHVGEERVFRELNHFGGGVVLCSKYDEQPPPYQPHHFTSLTPLLLSSLPRLRDPESDRVLHEVSKSAVMKFTSLSLVKNA